MMDDSKKNEFVSLFPKNKKSSICNKILSEIRSGNNYPPSIAINVLDKLNKYPDDNREIISVLENNPFMYMDAIVYYIEYEKMPYEDKQKLKQVNNKTYMDEAMAVQPISPKQVGMLKHLGYTGDFNMSKLDASQMIDGF